MIPTIQSVSITDAGFFVSPVLNNLFLYIGNTYLTDKKPSVYFIVILFASHKNAGFKVAVSGFLWYN